MPNYANGKIYKITSGDLTYIGSTCEPTLARRLAGHIQGYRQWKNGKYGKTSSFQVFETGNYEKLKLLLVKITYPSLYLIKLQVYIVMELHGLLS